MSRQTRILAIATIILTGWADLSLAQATTTDSADDRPKIGLVLGGGGARGAAHIGVLKELERQRIPVDAIAGTSMGAIVGGLYATGMTPTELEKLVESLDWKEAFSDESSRNNKRFRRKEDDAEFPANIELGFSDGSLQIPKGVIQGQKLGLILRELTLPAALISDFDDLPIPFRAVASDLVAGEAYVMGNGDLALAIRASMSAPAVFAPVEIDGRMLVDGGIVANVPVDAIKMMDVDVIIAVDVEFPLYKADDLNSAVAISAQVLTILIRKESVRQISQLGDDDVLIRPELGEFGSTDFAEITKAIQPGIAATIAESDRLSRLALDEESYREHLAARVTAERIDHRLAFVRVIDEGPLSSNVLQSRLHTEVGDKVDPRELAADANRLHGLSLYEQVDYKLIIEEIGTGVEFRTRAKAWGPNFLNFGIALEDNFEGTTSFNVSGRMTRGGINSLGAEWRTDLQLGSEPVVFSEFYQPLSFDSRFFVAPRVLWEVTNFNVFVDGDQLARYRVSEGEIGLDVGRELGLWGEIRFGAFSGRGTAKLKTGSPVFPNVSFDTGGTFASFQIDTLDNAQIPLHGARVKIEWLGSRTGLGADEEFDAIESDFNYAWTKGRHTFSAGVTFNTTVDADLSIQNLFALGGFLNMSGLSRGELSGPHAGLAKLVYYRRSGAMGGLFDVPFYVGGSLEAGNVWASRSDMSLDSTLINGSLFAGFDTFIGPVLMAAGFGEGGSKNFYLTFGTSIQ
jgi:NTE family protein